MPHPKIFLLFTLLFIFAACTPRHSDPAEFLTLNQQREVQLLGSWKLVQLRDGKTPAPNQARTLTFQNDHKLLIDLWEHQLTYTYEAMPDPDHLRLTWVSSTNLNDRPDAVTVYALRMEKDALSLDGDQYKRVALANGATLTPPAQTVLQTPTVAPNAQNIVNARLGEEFSLRVQQTGILLDSPNQFGIMFYNVAQDSRCPQGVVCAWAGEVRVQITFQERGLLHPPILELTTNPGDERRKIRVEDYWVELVQVEPPRIEGVPIAPKDYVATFRVTPAPATPTPVSNVTTGALDQPLTVKMFQPVEFPQAQLRVTMNGLLQESRCPKSVNCFQAGRAVMAFLLERNERIGMFELSTSPPDGRTRAYFQGYAVELLSVQPYPETPNDNTPAAKYLATIVVRKMTPPQVVSKNEGFVLKIGQTAQIQDENVQVKLVSVGKDSRCPYMVMCAVQGNAPVEVTLTEANGTQYQFILNTHDTKNNQRIPDSGLYGMELLALTPYPRADGAAKEIAAEEYEATLLVRKFASPQNIPTKTPTRVIPTACLGLTNQDAEAILGEAVQTKPVANVLIKIPADETFANLIKGVCGYFSVAPNTSDVVLMQEPNLDPRSFGAALTAARLQGANVLELARIASIVRFANPNADATDFMILQTRLAAGDWDGLFDSIEALGRGGTQLTMERVDSFGDDGLWIWRQGTQNNYAALLVRDHDSYMVIEALTDKSITQAAAQESIRAAMSKILK